jgi:putative hydrolase of the HAD superfamily
MKMQHPPDVDWLCFDLDNTLYPLSNGLWGAIDHRIQSYVAETLNLPLDEAKKVQKHYWRTYGTTLAGLMAEHGVQPGPYLAYVHNFDVSPYMGPNPRLKALLAALPQHKLIFTNASSQHAHNVLRALEVESFFEYVIGVEEVDYLPKPDPRAYEKCLALTGVTPARSMFLDDLPENLKPAKKMGMITALVSAQNHVAVEYVDYHLTRIEDLATVFDITLPEADDSARD